MSNEKPTILVVDDEPANIELMQSILGSDYKILASTSGEKAVKLVQSQSDIELILLDVMMPGMDGYEVCRAIKKNPDTKAIDIIFVSALDELEEVMTGYEVGGSDYLIKPIKAEELLKKVTLAISNHSHRKSVEKEKKSAMNAAITAISNVGEQGIVLDFFRRSFKVSSIQELAQLIIEATSSFGLENSVQIRNGEDIYYASTEEPMSPLEQELLSRLKDAGRLRERGITCVANYGAITQLVKNMPESEEKRGRIRDHLALLLEGAEARLESLEMQEELSVAIHSAKDALLSIEKDEKQFKKNAINIVDSMTQEMESALFSYDLTEKQEESLVEILSSGVSKSLDNLDYGSGVDGQLRDIVSKLSRFTK
ncbi:MAG: response regulator [Cellvibrionaceae bacterium]